MTTPLFPTEAFLGDIYSRKQEQTGAFKSLHTGNTSVVRLLVFFCKRHIQVGVVSSVEGLGDFKAAVPGVAGKERAGQGQL